MNKNTNATSMIEFLSDTAYLYDKNEFPHLAVKARVGMSRLHSSFSTNMDHLET